MIKTNAYIEVIHCMKFYLRDILISCPEDYYRKRKSKVLSAAKEVLDEASYKALLIIVENMEGGENA